LLFHTTTWKSIKMGKLIELSQKPKEGVSPVHIFAHITMLESYKTISSGHVK